MTDVSKIDMERINGLLDKLEEITNKLNSMKYVIETGQSEDGSQWYRVWSDGWIEQGGHKLVHNYIYFIKNFSNTNYIIVGNTSNATSSTDEQYYANNPVNFTAKTKSSAYIRLYNNAVFGIDWYACGY
jgi:hypothetical protein